MTRFPFDPPTGWVPSIFVDEYAPPSRKTPDASIVERFAASGAVMLAGTNEKAERVEERGRIRVGSAEVVSFDACFDLGTVEITIAPDGSWTSEDPIPAAASVFWERGEVETINFTMDAFAREWAGLVITPDELPATVKVECWHWVDGIRFVLGSRNWLNEPAFIPVQSVGGRVSEEAS